MRNTIKVQRAKKDITQQQLADALGLSRQTMNYIELKKYIPSLELSFKMAKYFNVPVEELFIPDDED